MIISYVITTNTATIIYDNKQPSTIFNTHPKYNQIVNCLIERMAISEKEIEQLLDINQVIDQYLVGVHNKLKYNKRTQQLTFDGRVVNLNDQIIKMISNDQPSQPLINFIEKLVVNPSAVVIDRLYQWVTVNGLTITEDGCLLGYKRVRDDYTSFYDSKTLHVVGQKVQLPVDCVDFNSDNTCSRGLHFCSQRYLPNYCSGLGRVLILKIDPSEIAAIPLDYQVAKARAIGYTAIGEITGIQRHLVESENVLTNHVYQTDKVEQIVNNSGDINNAGYQLGFKHGKWKQKNIYNNCQSNQFVDSYQQGFQAGKRARNSQRK